MSPSPQLLAPVGKVHRSSLAVMVLVLLLGIALVCSGWRKREGHPAAQTWTWVPNTGKPTKKSRNEDGSPTATEEDTKESQQRTVEFHAELQRHAARIAQAIAVAPPDC